MAKASDKVRQKRKAVRAARLVPQESQSGEAVTIAWTVAVTMTLVCNLAAIGAYFYFRANPGASLAGVFRDVATFAGAVIGLLVLALIPPVYKLRRVPPPAAFTVFAACAAAAPIVALVVRAIQ